MSKAQLKKQEKAY